MSQYSAGHEISPDIHSYISIKNLLTYLLTFISSLCIYFHMYSLHLKPFVCIFCKSFACLLNQGGASAVEDPSLRRRLYEAGNTCGTAYKELLEQINLVSVVTFAFM